MTAIEQAIASFIDYIRTVRRLSPHTVAAYRRDLATLAAGIGDMAPAQISAVELRRLIANNRRAKPASIIRQLAVWRAFFDFLIAGDAAAKNPVHAIPAPKRPASLPKALTPDEMNALLTPAGQEDSWLAGRDAAMMELLYSSALRLSELTQLNINDLDLAGGCVYIQRGKGGEGRVAPMGQRARRALSKWLRQRQALLADAAVQPALFIGRNQRRLGARAVQKRIDQHVKKSGFAKPVSPHMFRHSCASHFLQSSGDLRATQQLLGHKNIATTQIYTRLDFQHLAKVYDGAHPRAKK